MIGGYLKRDDPFFDALIVGQYEGADLLYKEKVRFGFDDEKKRRLLGFMEPLRLPECPFHNLPERRRRGALDDQQMAEAVWGGKSSMTILLVILDLLLIGAIPAWPSTSRLNPMEVARGTTHLATALGR